MLRLGVLVTRDSTGWVNEAAVGPTGGIAGVADRLSLNSTCIQWLKSRLKGGLNATIVSVSCN